MKFLPFVDISDFSVSDKKLLQKVLIAFFSTPRLKGYFDAILRNGELKHRENIKNLLINFLNIVGDEQSKINSEGYLKLIKTIEASTSKASVNNQTAPDEDIKKQHINEATKQILFKKRLTIEAIEAIVKRLGRAAIQLEHQKAMKYATSYRLMDFDEYLSYCWSEVANHKAQEFQPTILQWENYLSYVKNLVLPYKNLTCHTENRKQALQLYEKTNIISNKFKRMETLLIESSVKCYNLHQQVKRYDQKIFIYQCYLNFLTANNKISFNEKLADFVDLLKAIIMSLEGAQEDIKTTLNDTQMLVNKNSSLYSDSSGKLDRDSELVTLIQPELHYWNDNLPRIANREPDTKKLMLFSKNQPPKYNDVLYRFITNGERESLIENKQFSQSTKSSEREKWFFGAKACPGDGVTHAYRCEIKLKTGTLALLRQLVKPDGQYAAVVKKANETDCLGIHEDVLPAFNSLIGTVIIKDTAEMKKTRRTEIGFDKKQHVTESQSSFFSKPNPTKSIQKTSPTAPFTKKTFGH